MATKNLRHIHDELLNHYDLLSEGNRQTVRDRIEQVLGRIEAEPKILKWKTRARIGTPVE